MIKLSEILTEEYIKINFSAKSKDDLIKRMIKIIEKSPYVLDIEKVEEAVFTRERSVTTGIGNGLALPHAKTDGVTENIVALAITDKPIDFDSADELPVRIVFLLVGKDSTLHLKFLSRFSNLIKDEESRQKLIDAKSAKEVYAIIKTQKI